MQSLEDGYIYMFCASVIGLASGARCRKVLTAASLFIYCCWENRNDQIPRITRTNAQAEVEDGYTAKSVVDFECAVRQLGAGHAVCMFVAEYSDD